MSVTATAVVLQMGNILRWVDAFHIVAVRGGGVGLGLGLRRLLRRPQPSRAEVSAVLHVVVFR